MLAVADLCKELRLTFLTPLIFEVCLALDLVKWNNQPAFKQSIFPSFDVHLHINEFLYAKPQSW